MADTPLNGLITQNELSDILSKKINDSDTTSKLNKQQIGTLTSLQTTNKNNLVDSINEVFQCANNGKTLIANVICVPTTNDKTWEDIKNDIQNCKNNLAKNLNDKDVSVNNRDSLLSLVNAVGNIETMNPNKIHIETALGSWSYYRYEDTHIPLYGTYVFDLFVNNPFRNTNKKVLRILLYIKGQIQGTGYIDNIDYNNVLENPKEQKVLVFHDRLSSKPSSYPDALFVLIYSD